MSTKCFSQHNVSKIMQCSRFCGACQLCAFHRFSIERKLEGISLVGQMFLKKVLGTVCEPAE